MKKSIFIKTLFILAVFSVLFCVLIACEQKPLSSATYTSTIKEDGVTVTYSLLIDENNKTFSLSKVSDTQSKYSGTYTLQNGYYTLTSESKGTEYVKVVGNEFFYIDISSDEPVICEHNYVQGKEVKGNCSQKGYIEYKCSLCNQVKKESTVLGSHDYKDTSYTKGTCLVKGKTVKTCRICSNVITVNDENFGDHKYTDPYVEDKGCNTLLVERTRCTFCEKIVERELTTLGKHKYVNGVCTICKYDETGICHDHYDGNNDNICDGCTLPYSYINKFNENGYYLDTDGTLYLGAYPSTESLQPTASDIIKYGKIDPSTGYYRHNKSSYKIVEKNNVKRAYLVTPIKWTPVVINSTTYYVCNQIIEKRQYLNDVNLSKITEKINGEFITNYYNNKITDEKIFANNFENSDIFEYANSEFLDKALLSTTVNKIIGDVILPNSDFKDIFINNSNYKCDYTDYAKTTGYDNISSCPIFTSDNSTTDGVKFDTNKVLVFYSTLDGENDGIVTTNCGFLPIIKFNAN